MKLQAPAAGAARREQSDVVVTRLDAAIDWIRKSSC